ncbi:hypothetical protein F2P47_13130 [Parvibaculum sedimenti]|uniref:DUF3108 domain-containing protein n=1 Tax=Parvibaculum sedimenti TaxID=2608632 RepID=A0A6N6VG01_9HYPH|nr:DUF6134 family protein [Parvibaculum sedimenti]KAB7739160.1 hypothetical protein F2P47_13130 [Parvibaculum sedimenti]
MILAPRLACAASLIASTLIGNASAATRTDTYKVEHPLYGDIGTYVYNFDDANGVTRITSQLHVAITLIGIVIYRQDSDQQEVLQNGHLISLKSVTRMNGRQSTVHGEARDGRFFITAASGTTSAPASVLPSDPWSLKRIGLGVVVSTKSGKIYNVKVTGGEADTVLLQGMSISARHFRIRTEAQEDKWEVWLDAQGVPIKFRSLEDGEQIDFILTSTSSRAADTLSPATSPDLRSSP